MLPIARLSSRALTARAQALHPRLVGTTPIIRLRLCQLSLLGPHPSSPAFYATSRSRTPSREVPPEKRDRGWFPSSQLWTTVGRITEKVGPHYLQNLAMLCGLMAN